MDLSIKGVSRQDLVIDPQLPSKLEIVDQNCNTSSHLGGMSIKELSHLTVNTSLDLVNNYSDKLICQPTLPSATDVKPHSPHRFGSSTKLAPKAPLMESSPPVSSVLANHAEATSPYSPSCTISRGSTSTSPQTKLYRLPSPGNLESHTAGNPSLLIGPTSPTTMAPYKELSWREKDRRRRFREEWKHMWLVIPHGRFEVMCLVCQKIMTQRKLDTIKRHTVRRHVEVLSLEESERSLLFDQLAAKHGFSGCHDSNCSEAPITRESDLDSMPHNSGLQSKSTDETSVDEKIDVEDLKKEISVDDDDSQISKSLHAEEDQEMSNPESTLCLPAGHNNVSIVWANRKRGWASEPGAATDLPAVAACEPTCIVSSSERTSGCVSIQGSPPSKQSRPNTSVSESSSYSHIQHLSSLPFTNASHYLPTPMSVTSSSSSATTFKPLVLIPPSSVPATVSTSYLQQHPALAAPPLPTFHSQHTPHGSSESNLGVLPLPHPSGPPSFDWPTPTSPSSSSFATYSFIYQDMMRRQFHSQLLNQPGHGHHSFSGYPTPAGGLIPPYPSPSHPSHHSMLPAPTPSGLPWTLPPFVPGPSLMPPQPALTMESSNGLKAFDCLRKEGSVGAVTSPSSTPLFSRSLSSHPHYSSSLTTTVSSASSNPSTKTEPQSLKRDRTSSSTPAVPAALVAKTQQPKKLPTSAAAVSMTDGAARMSIKDVKTTATAKHKRIESPVETKLDVCGENLNQQPSTILAGVSSSLELYNGYLTTTSSNHHQSATTPASASFSSSSTTSPSSVSSPPSPRGHSTRCSVSPDQNRLGTPSYDGFGSGLLLCQTLRVFAGQDVMPGVDDLLTRRGWASAFVLSCWGQVDTTRLRTLQDSGLVNGDHNSEDKIVTLTGPLTLLSLTGSFTASTNGSQPLSLSLADAQGQVTGGQLVGQLTAAGVGLDLVLGSTAAEQRSPPSPPLPACCCCYSKKLSSHRVSHKGSGCPAVHSHHDGHRSFDLLQASGYCQRSDSPHHNKLHQQATADGMFASSPSKRHHLNSGKHDHNICSCCTELSSTSLRQHRKLHSSCERRSCRKSCCSATSSRSRSGYNTSDPKHYLSSASTAAAAACSNDTAANGQSGKTVLPASELETTPVTNASVVVEKQRSV